MKKYNLDETWRLCLKMWKWIVKEWKRDKSQYIEDLKGEWLRKHDFADEIYSDCFFCHFCEDCGGCPGRLVNKKFSCADNSYDYEKHPDKFLAKLRSMNKKRKAKK